MGQSTSLNLDVKAGRDIFSNEFDFLHEQIRKHSLTLRQLTTLTYDDLQSKITELNDLSSRFVDCNGKQLVFELKDAETAPAVLWKGLVRVRCMKTDPSTGLVEKCRDLNLKQFLQVYNTMTQMQHTMQHSNEGDKEKDAGSPSRQKWNSSSEQEGTSSGAVGGMSDSGDPETPVGLRKKPVFNMSTSLILSELDEAGSPTSMEECCICMENKPEVSLPCAHSYCLACIEQWNVDHKTCPICREKLENTDETWVLEDKPDAQDMAMEMTKSFMGLTK